LLNKSAFFSESELIKELPDEEAPLFRVVIISFIYVCTNVSLTVLWNVCVIYAPVIHRTPFSLWSPCSWAYQTAIVPIQHSSTTNQGILAWETNLLRWSRIFLRSPTYPKSSRQAFELENELVMLRKTPWKMYKKYQHISMIIAARKPRPRESEVWTIITGSQSRNRIHVLHALGYKGPWNLRQRHPFYFQPCRLTTRHRRTRTWCEGHSPRQGDYCAEGSHFSVIVKMSHQRSYLRKRRCTNSFIFLPFLILLCDNVATKHS